MFLQIWSYCDIWREFRNIIFLTYLNFFFFISKNNLWKGKRIIRWHWTNRFRDIRFNIYIVFIKRKNNVVFIQFTYRVSILNSCIITLIELLIYPKESLTFFCGLEKNIFFFTFFPFKFINSFSYLLIFLKFTFILTTPN